MNIIAYELAIAPYEHNYDGSIMMDVTGKGRACIPEDLTNALNISSCVIN